MDDQNSCTDPIYNVLRDAFPDLPSVEKVPFSRIRMGGTYSRIYRANLPNADFPLAVKVCLDDDLSTLDCSSAERQFKALKRADDILRPYPNFKVSTPVYLDKAKAIVIMEWVEGVSLQHTLIRSKMNIENVLAQFRQSGAWLKAFHAGCELESVKVESLEVLSVLEKNLEESYPNWRSSRFMIKVMAFLEAHRSDIDGQNLGWGYIHDDFHPNNLIFCGEVLVGIDFNGSQKNFALSDLVTYLNHLAHLSMLPKGIKIRHHLSAFEAAFLAGYGMDKRQDSQLSLQWLRIVRALRFFASFRCNSQNPLKNAYFQTVSRYNINTLLTNFSHIKDSLAK